MQKFRFFTLILIPLLLVICLGVLLGGYFVINLPKRAEQTFGQPSANLNRWQIIRFSALLLLKTNTLTSPIDPSANEEKKFTITLGESTNAIIGRLWEEGLINDQTAFRLYLQYTGLDTGLQAGEYRLSPAMSPIQIAHALQDATPMEVTFIILPGWRLEEIAAALPTSGLSITPEEFLAAAQSYSGKAEITVPIPAYASLEGFLFPGSYTLPRQTNVNQILEIFVNNFAANISSELLQAFERQDLTLYEAITLASIVEREALQDEEKPLIASVFLNRLKAGMRLDADPTVQYALGYRPERGGWWPVPLTRTDLQIDSPYNTYIYPGLPPGPIANPGLTAIQAVAFPAQTPYYYFRAACDGSKKHIFARTYEEHISNACP